MKTFPKKNNLFFIVIQPFEKFVKPITEQKNAQTAVFEMTIKGCIRSTVFGYIVFSLD